MSDQEQIRKEYWKIQKISTYVSIPGFVAAAYIFILVLIPSVAIPVHGDFFFVSYFFSLFTVIIVTVLILVCSAIVTFIQVYYIPRKFKCQCGHELGAHERPSGRTYEKCRGKIGLKYRQCDCRQYMKRS